MSEITKTICDHCGKEVADTYEEAGWIRLNGTLTRSWGHRRRDRSGQTDFLEKKTDFCSIDCLVKELDKLRREKGGPSPAKITLPAVPQPAEPKSETAWDRIGKDED